MFTFAIFSRQTARPSARQAQGRRRPFVEDLEGRQLLSAVNFIQGGHTGTGVAAVGGIQSEYQKIVITYAIQGNHIGTNVAAAGGVPNEYKKIEPMYGIRSSLHRDQRRVGRLTECRMIAGEEHQETCNSGRCGYTCRR